MPRSASAPCRSLHRPCDGVPHCHRAAQARVGHGRFIHAGVGRRGRRRGRPASRVSRAKMPPRFSPAAGSGASAIASALIRATCAARSASVGLGEARRRAGDGDRSDAGKSAHRHIDGIGCRLAGGRRRCPRRGAAAESAIEHGRLDRRQRRPACACQTWAHFEQRTLRPSGGNTAWVS